MGADVGGAPWLTPQFARGAADSASAAGDDVFAALEIARAVGRDLPLPEAGQTAQRWAALTAIGRANVMVARVVEPHCDALAILAEAGQADRAGSDRWGVFAAEAPGVRLAAEVDADGSARLTGTKPWCSLADHLDAALVTAWVDDDRRLFRVGLRQPGVCVEPGTGWVARGLPTVTSTAVRFQGVPATAVGDANWYLSRPGFWWGGIGVAACWYGGALGVADALVRRARTRQDPLLDLQVGAVDVALTAAGSVLAVAAATVDDERRVGAPTGRLLAERARAVVHEAAEHTLRIVGHALGPAPLAFDEAHAARTADLAIYLRQHHGERDLAALGAAVARPEADS